MTISIGDSVTIEYTGRLDDGRVFDTSRETVAGKSELDEPQSDRRFTPLTIDVGDRQVIEGLEDALVGMEQGDDVTVAIPPAQAYGERTKDEIRKYDPSEFSEMIGGESPEVGMRLETRQSGLVVVVHVGPETVLVDFNHRLAGETLKFDVEVVNVTRSTQGEN